MKRNNAVFYTVFFTLTLILTSKPLFSRAQEKLSPDSVEISLLTCSPYEMIYGLYGHTAIRVKNLCDSTDIAVNYGIFDKTKPNFILNFLLGRTDYSMAFYSLDYLVKEYGYYGSRITEHVLNLTPNEKIRILAALEENYLPQNRFYRYNFLYDNCATRPRDIIANNIEGTIKYKSTGMQEGDKTFRDLLHWKTADYPWATFGDDFICGVYADKVASFEQREFLPEVLMEDFANAVIVDEQGKTRPLVKATNTIIEKGESQLEPLYSFPLSPLAVSLIIFGITLIITIFERTKLKHRIKGFDETFLMLLGLIGLLLFVMIFSQHPTVSLNLQILLFNPLFLWLAWYFGTRKWCRNTIAVMLLLFFSGYLLQAYNLSVIILALSLSVRLYGTYYDKK